MVTCRECETVNNAGALFCSECGASLLELGGEVAVLDAPRAPKPPPLVGQQVGEADVPQEIILMIPLSGRRLTLPLKGSDIRIGRGTPGQDDPPEVDMTIENGAEYGVSRNHAVIRLIDQGVVLIDLDSTNGTNLNNYRLPPDLPYPIKSGDEIHFGSLLVHVFIR